MQKQWLMVRKWLRYYVVFKPLSYLPQPWAYRCTRLIGRYDQARQGDVQAAMIENWRRAFPEQTDTAVLEQWASRYFIMMARETMDVFVMHKLKAKHGRRLIRLHPQALTVLHQAQAEGRGVIIAMAHYGRLNMLLLGLALAGERLGMLTMVTDERNRDLDAVDRVYLRRKVTSLLRFIGGRWVTLGDDLRSLYRGLAKGETMVLLFDAYTPGVNSSRISMPFLAGQLSIAQGVERIARKTGARIVYGVAKEQEYTIVAELKSLATDPAQAIRQAIVALENDVKQVPWAWWQWPIIDYFWTPENESD